MVSFVEFCAGVDARWRRRDLEVREFHPISECQHHTQFLERISSVHHHPSTKHSNKPYGFGNLVIQVLLSITPSSVHS